MQLFRDHPRVVAKIKSVLIDEVGRSDFHFLARFGSRGSRTAIQFQDTNSVQYDIVKYIAAASNSLTIVGDPDQSSESARSNFGRRLADILPSAVYGWRNAEIENLEKMLKGKLLT